MASQITSLTTVYSTVYSGADQRKHQSSASLAFVWGIHRWPVNSPHKCPVTRKMAEVISHTAHDWRFGRKCLLFINFLTHEHFCNKHLFYRYYLLLNDDVCNTIGDLAQRRLYCFICFIISRKKHISIYVIHNLVDYDGRKINILNHDRKLSAIYIHIGDIKPYCDNSWSKVNIWNVNCTRATAFIFDSRMNVFVKGLKI